MTTESQGLEASQSLATANRDKMLVAGRNTAYLVIVALSAGAAFFVYRDAWVSDDALITFRYVDNFLNGEGASFNPGDRVQGYTHPLWFIVLTLATVFTRDEVYSAVILGVGLTFVTGMALGLGLLPLSRDRVTGLAAAALVLVLLSVSDTWRTFQTSGLEGSLSTLLTVLFVLSVARESVKPWQVFLLASLLVLCRPDFALIAAPACVYAANEVWRSKRFLEPALALTPLLWFVLAKVYYGDFMPNTAAAKLGTFTLQQGFDQGTKYLSDWLTNEPMSAIMAFFMLAVVLLYSPRRWDLLLCLGLAAYFFYVLLIGGDFMRGRFYTPFFVAAYVMGAVTIVRLATVAWRPQWVAGAVAGILLLAVGAPMTAREQSSEIEQSGIVNERMFYWPGYSFKSYRHHGRLINRAQPEGLIETYKKYVATCGPLTLHMRNPAYYGYYVGAKLRLIDLHGLNDAYIADLPNDLLVNRPPRPGHQVWRVPIKYLAQRRSASLVPDWPQKVQDLDCTLPQQADAFLNDPGYVTQ